jgi:hypothetical protein
LQADGSGLVYSAYLGGSVKYPGEPRLGFPCRDEGEDSGYGIALDGAGDAYVTGSTESCDFPVTPGAFQTSLAGSVYDPPHNTDTFVTKLTGDGSALVYSTYLGGNAGSKTCFGQDDIGQAIVVDKDGQAYVTGLAGSGSFPTTPGAFQTKKVIGCIHTYDPSDAFVTKLQADGSGLVYSTLLGGNPHGLFGSDPPWCSGADSANGIALDASGHAYVTGTTA